MRNDGKKRDRTVPGLAQLMRWLALLTCLAFCRFAAADGASKTRLVVVLYPHNNDGSPGNSLVNQSIRSIFANNSALIFGRFTSSLCDLPRPRKCRTVRCARAQAHHSSSEGNRTSQRFSPPERIGTTNGFVASNVRYRTKAASKL